VLRRWWDCTHQLCVAGATSPFLKKKIVYREEDVWMEVVGLYPRSVRGRYSIDLPY